MRIYRATLAILFCLAFQIKVSEQTPAGVAVSVHESVMKNSKDALVQYCARMINEVHIDDLQAFSLNLLEPRGSTPLFDAIGLAIYSLQNIDTFSDDKKVLVIVTDGRENSSREYNYADISEMIMTK